MTISDYESYDAVGLAELVERHEVSAEEVLESAIVRTEQRNAALNAVVTTMYDEAREAVRDGVSGPLAGVPFLIKDLAYVKGVRCSYGSRLWEDFVPDHDAHLVTRYRQAGLVIFGKTNTPEVGLAPTTESVLLGPCRNPWDLDRTPGGSSGGAAAAVAAGVVPVAHATDGGGSIRIPASCCGLVGLKPTRARTPLGPDVGEGWGSMATANVVSRSVRDTAALLDVSHGPASGDPYHAPHFGGSYLKEHTTHPGQLRIAIDLEPVNGSEVHKDCVAGVQHVAALCEKLGHRVEETAFDYDRETLGGATGTLVLCNVRNNVLSRARELGVELSEANVEKLTLAFVEMAGHVGGDEYAAAINTIHRTSRYVERFFKDYDLILSPTLVCPPVALGYLDTNGDREIYNRHFNEFWGFTNLYNATGNPAISLPLHWTKEGWPVGIQFAASFGDELLLLRVANQLHEAQPWFDRRPPALG